MNPLVVFIAFVAIVLLITGGIVQSLNFLLWIGGVLLVIALIVFLFRVITGQKKI